ncbi:hypothetical protein ACFRR7_05465 [Streptomyces sp. NPDC056909]|uniref:hypothetical protein n=1 Tax=Streptomyces sp. NPDC056909 TaxID=3345963 RepID=UPI00368E87A6
MPRRVTGDGLVTTVTLASYRHEEKAVAALTDLSTAADGFPLKSGGDEHQVTGATRELALQGADQAMGFGITRRTDGTDTTEKIVVMRRGPVIALFTTTTTTTASDVAPAAGKSAGKTAEPLAVPLTIVETQLIALA